MSGKGAALAPLPYITYEARPWCALIGHVDALRASFVYARVRVHHRALDHCMYMQPARKMRTVARTGSATADLKPSHGVSQWPGGLANFKGGWGSVRVLPPVSPPKSAAPCACRGSYATDHNRCPRAPAQYNVHCLGSSWTRGVSISTDELAGGEGCPPCACRPCSELLDCWGRIPHRRRERRAVRRCRPGVATGMTPVR